MLQFEDANGPLLRGSVLQSCNTAYLADSLTESRPYLRTVQELTNVPPSTPICEIDPPPIPPAADRPMTFPPFHPTRAEVR